MAGWVKLNVRDTEKGDTILMRYAERLTNGGDSLYTANLRDAWSRDIYIANGKGKTRSGAPASPTTASATSRLRV